VKQVTLAYAPREQFIPFHQRTERWALMVCHRRAGKTVACVNEAVIRGLYTTKKNARYGYVAPYRQQAKEIAWTYLKEATKDLRVEPPRESELRVKLPNDVWITLYGADNPDALRGLYFDGLILDEFGDMKPSLMGEVILPCLADREGWLAVIGTAKGRNQFYDYKRMAENDPKWYYQMLRASESGIIAPQELDNLRNNMTEDQFEQEMECSFDAALQGTYFADAINLLDKKQQLVRDDVLYDPNQKVHVAADVGLRDSTAWWFWQPRMDGFAIIDYYEASGMHVDHYLQMLKDRDYDYKEIWLPHDAKAKTLATRRSTVEQFLHPHEVAPNHWPRGSRLPIRIVPKLAVQHGIDAARLMMPKCYFDMHRCEPGVDALRAYRRQYHEHTKQYSDTPMHDWASNGADAFRYFALAASKGAPEISHEQRQREARDKALSGLSDAPKLSLNNLFADREANNRFNRHRI
jgi:hypothetical protein